MNYLKQHYLPILFVVCFICSLVAIENSNKDYRLRVGILDSVYAEQKNIKATTSIKIDSDVTVTFKGSVFFAREYESDRRYKVSAPTDDVYEFGKCLTVVGTLSLPSTKQTNSNDETSPLYNFPYREYLAKDGIYELLNVKKILSHTDCENLSKYEKVQLYFIRLKHRYTKIFLEQYEQPYAGFVAGVLVAGKGLMSNETLELFKRTSLSHVVVLSGSNVSIILVCIKLCIDVLFFWKKEESILVEWLKKIFILIAVWSFVLLTGGGAPIYRAAVSAFCGLILFTSKTSKVYALTIVVLLMTIQNPFQTLYDPSFHLTCCATYGLILFSKPIDMKICLSWLRFIPNWLREIISVTLATQILVFPYIMFMTSSFSSVFLLSNVLVLPMIPLIMLFGFVTMIAVLCNGWLNVSIFVNLSVYINMIFLHLVFSIVEILAHVPCGYIQFKKSTSVIVLVLYALLFLFICIRWNRKPK